MRNCTGSLTLSFMLIRVALHVMFLSWQAPDWAEDFAEHGQCCRPSRGRSSRTSGPHILQSSLSGQDSKPSTSGRCLCSTSCSSSIWRPSSTVPSCVGRSIVMSPATFSSPETPFEVVVACVACAGHLLCCDSVSRRRIFPLQSGSCSGTWPSVCISSESNGRLQSSFSVPCALQLCCVQERAKWHTRCVRRPPLLLLKTPRRRWCSLHQAIRHCMQVSSTTLQHSTSAAGL